MFLPCGFANILLYCIIKSGLSCSKKSKADLTPMFNDSTITRGPDLLIPCETGEASNDPRQSAQFY